MRRKKGIVMPYRVFIAYSGKNSELGDAVALRLGESLEADRWPYTFRFGEGIFEGLLQKGRQYDFGVFAFSPDDFQRVDGGRNFLAPNVVFELGVFAGSRGKERAFLLMPKGNEADLPADLQGITHATYDPDHLERSVEQTCLAIKKQIGEVQCSDCHFLLNKRSGQCLDVQALGRGEGNPVIQWPYHGGPNQLWSLEKLPEGWFKIVSKNSGKCLQVRGASQEEDAVVEQGTYTGATHQQWSLTPFGNGTYQVRVRHSDKCLYVPSEDKEAPIVQRTWRQDDSFLWWLADAFTLN
jgi:hypothetical protein